MLGDFGTVASAGGAPRPAGTVCTSSVRLSGIHWTTPPAPCLTLTALTTTPFSLHARADAASPAQSSIPVSVVLVKAKRLPSWLHTGIPTRAPCGSSTFRSDPSAIFLSVIET
jgi:hypothetical protein